MRNTSHAKGGACTPTCGCGVRQKLEEGWLPHEYPHLEQTARRIVLGKTTQGCAARGVRGCVRATYLSTKIRRGSERSTHSGKRRATRAAYKGTSTPFLVVDLEQSVSQSVCSYYSSSFAHGSSSPGPLSRILLAMILPSSPPPSHLS